MLSLLTWNGICITLGVLIVAVKMEDISVCKAYFKYHASTHTCMRLVNQSTSYDTSKDTCRTYKGGPKNKNFGHLVYIYNEDTDNFVKDLLPDDLITAHIGLNYLRHEWRNIYRWGDSKEPLIYVGWDGSAPTPRDSNVVISKNGWKQMPSFTKTAYICQVDADIELPQITMTCPTVQLGQPSPEIECVIGKSFRITGSEFSANKVIASCNTTKCLTTDGYTVYVKDNGPSLSMSLSIMAAQRSDDGLLTCEWTFAGQLGKLRTSCNVTVHDPPTTPPELTILPNREVYKERDVISLTCAVNGGSPPVQSTTLSCDREIKDTATALNVVIVFGNVADMRVSITEEMNDKSCNCSAIHTSKLYNLKSSLRLSVIAPAKVDTFTFTNSVAKGNVLEVDVNRQLRITCSASGNPTPSISLYYTDNQHLLNEETGYQLIHSIRTSCNDSGKYICAASNIHNEAPHTLLRIFRIRCRPTLCTTEERNPQYGVALNTDATIEMCVYAYPKPSTLYLYKGSVSIPSEKYSIKFNYTDEVQCRGLISLTVRDIRQDDFVKYKFVMDREFLLFDFSFTPQGPPACPKGIQVKNVFTDMVTLAWKPGHNGGLPQTFIILRHDSKKEVGRVQDNNSDLIEYNVTGLSAMTSYLISIHVENIKGCIQCPDVDVNVTTNATSSAERSESSVSPSAYIIPIVVLLVLAVIGILIVIVVRRRTRSRQDLKKMLLLEEVKTRPPKLEESKDKEEDKSLHSSIYNNSALDTSEPKNKIKAIVRKPKGSSSKSKHASAKDVNSKADSGVEGDTYAQVLKVKKQKGDKAEAAENIYNNQLEMVNFNGQKSSPGTTDQSASDWPKNKTNEAGDDHVVYANTIQSSSPVLSEPKASPEPNTSVATKNEKSARTLSPEGLVYVSVEINAATKNPTIKEHKETKQPEVDQVEYMSIDYLATSESNLMVDDGQE